MMIIGIDKCKNGFFLKALQNLGKLQQLKMPVKGVFYGY